MKAYDELVARSPQGSVFASSWWLDAVAPGAWRAHEIEDGGELVAAWPTVVKRNRFGPVHTGAPLTPFLGPLYAARGKPLKRRAQEINLLELLLERIGPFAYLEARCHPAFDYWTPLAWHGFSQTTHYTWRLPRGLDAESVWGDLRENIRREVRKAEKRGVTVAESPLGEFEELRRRRATHDAGGGGSAALARIEPAAAARGRRTILLARDADGLVHAGGYFVHDDDYVYYLSGASEPELRSSGAGSLVLWKAIEMAAERGLGFDFEGSMLPGVERFFRAFGGEPAPYSIVRKTASRGLRVVRPFARMARSLGA